MRILWFAVLILGLSGCSVEQMSRYDKEIHMAGGAAIAGYVTHKSGERWKGCAAALGVGMLKEIIDTRTNRHASVSDAAATGLGCVVTYAF